jgi:hypothetical protein
LSPLSPAPLWGGNCSSPAWASGLVPSVVAAIIFGLLNVWVLLVEILR